jgi:acetyl esterase/lipase
VLRTGHHAFKWLEAPHVPHGWESGLMMELETRTLLVRRPLHAGRLRRRGPHEGDILGPSEAFRRPMDYYAHAPQTAATLERIAREQPQVLACMHGSAWQGDGASLLRALARSLATSADRSSAAAIDLTA